MYSMSDVCYVCVCMYVPYNIYMCPYVYLYSTHMCVCLCIYVGCMYVYVCGMYVCVYIHACIEVFDHYGGNLCMHAYMHRI